MSVARFIAGQRTEHQVPGRADLPGAGDQRLVVLQVDQPATDSAAGPPGRAGRGGEAGVRGSTGTYGSPRVHAELVALAPAASGSDAPPARVWQVSVNTVADSMRQGMLGRNPKRRQLSLSRSVSYEVEFSERHQQLLVTEQGDSSSK